MTRRVTKSQINLKTKKAWQLFAMRFKRPGTLLFRGDTDVSWQKPKPHPRSSSFMKSGAGGKKGFQPAVRMHMQGSVLQQITNLRWDGMAK